MFKWLIRPLLFQLQPETAHHLIITLLKILLAIPGMKLMFRAIFTYNHPSLEREVFGIQFKNPVGLAAGFDKDAKAIDELATLGFGFIEIGTITPKEQPGNDKPRLFRLPDDYSLVNRMGFNNKGVEAATKRLRSKKSTVIIGGNIGKNKQTPNERAVEDYIHCMELLHPLVDYFVVNVSSPNTPDLRELQEREPLKKLLQVLIIKNREFPKPKPILLKVSPDLNTRQLDDIIDISRSLKLDGIIATNTSVERNNLTSPTKHVDSIGEGGLSGKALRIMSNDVIRYLHEGLKAEIPIIGVGGIFSERDVFEKLAAGASLVQVYTGLIYEGPSLVKKINKKIAHAGI